MNAGYITTMDRDRQDTKGKIRMCPSGRYVNPLALRADDLDIVDIAHHLSIVNRYTGGTPMPYSVAQHSVWVSHQFKDRDLAFAGLMHDAAEAYLNDIASPVKRSPVMAGYVDAMGKAERLIFATYGIDWPLMAAIKPADDAAFLAEVKSFWEPTTLLSRDRIHPKGWADAKRDFLWRFRVLGGLNLRTDGPLLDIQRPFQSMVGDQEITV